MSFTKKRFTGKQLPRMAALSARWLQLKHSFAPMATKLAAPPAVFWSAGLHGIAGSCMGGHHVDNLRVQAMKALRLNKAGANGKLRLSLTLCRPWILALGSHSAGLSTALVERTNAWYVLAPFYVWLRWFPF